jgi:hypothetical protein
MQKPNLNLNEEEPLLPSQQLSPTTTSNPEESFKGIANGIAEALPAFRDLVDKLSSASLKRCLKVIVEHPVEQSVELKNQDEREVANLGFKLKQDMVALAIESIKMEAANINKEKEVKETENGEERK